MQYKTKKALIDDCETEWTTLWTQLDQLSERQMLKRTSKTARSLKDDLAHLYAWHLLLLKWLNSAEPVTPSPGYKWSDIRRLNDDLHAQYESVPLVSIKRRLKLSHRRVMKKVVAFSERELIEKGYFKWTGKSSLAVYVGANAASHYRWAQKRVKPLLKA